MWCRSMVWTAHRPKLITDCFSRFGEVSAMADLSEEQLLEALREPGVIYVRKDILAD